jgi:hypothetical protein
VTVVVAAGLSTPFAGEVMGPRGAALAALALLLLPPSPRGADPSACSNTFYADDELPRIHAIDLNVSLAGFQALVEHQQDRRFPELGVTATINGASYAGAKIKPHGGVL